jgi:hypothetical protein
LKGRLPHASAILILALSLLAAGYIHTPRASGGQPGYSLDYLRGVAVREWGVDPSTREGYYLLNVSGRILQFRASSLPGLVGRRVGSFCFLAYVRGRWVRLPFTVYSSRNIIHSRRGDLIVYTIPERVGPRDVVAVKMPMYMPEAVDPTLHTPPEARGARAWGYVYLAPRGAPYTYPVLLVADTPRIRETCGGTPYRYGQNFANAIDWLEAAPDVPWLFQEAQRRGMEPSLDAILDYETPLPARVNTSLQAGWLRPPRPLPDGGGGTSPETAIIDYVASPSRKVETQSGPATWEDVVLEVDPDNPATINLYPYSPSAGIEQGDVLWTTLAVTLIAKPKDGTVAASATLKIFPGTSDEVSRTVELYSFGETAVATAYFDPPESYVSFASVVPLEVSVSQGSWEIVLLVRYMFKLYNYEDYIPSKAVYPALFSPLTPSGRGYESYDRIAFFYIPYGERSDAQAFPIAGPSQVALIERVGLDNVSVPFQVSFQASLPAGFPGGNITLILPGSAPCTVHLDPTDTPEDEDFTCIVNTEPLTALLPAFDDPTRFGVLNLTLDEPNNNPNHEPIMVEVKIHGYHYPYVLNAIPILSVHHPNATESYDKEIMSPIANYNSLDVSTQAVARLDAFLNPHKYTSDAYRWAALHLRVSARGSNVYAEFSVEPIEMSDWINNYFGVGKIDFFNATVILSGPGATNGGGDIIVKGLSSQGSLPSALEGYLHIARTVVSFAARVIGSLKRFSDVLGAITLALKYKNIVSVSTGISYSGSTIAAWAGAVNSGWAPDGFQNDIVIRFYDLNAIPDCEAKLDSYLIVGTESTSQLALFPSLGYWSVEDPTVCRASYGG